MSFLESIRRRKPALRSKIFIALVGVVATSSTCRASAADSAPAAAKPNIVVIMADDK